MRVLRLARETWDVLAVIDHAVTVKALKDNLDRYRKMFEEAEQSVEYWAEGAIVEFTEALWARMEEEKVSRAELARRLGTSKAYVTKVLGGNANFTLYSLAKLAFAVGAKVRVSVEPIVPVARKPRPQKLAPAGTNSLGEKADPPTIRAKPRRAATAALGSESKT
ncbi:MAG: helix-turn-helix transcriptional regulator [Acidobacteriota bacterium]